jgi:2-polyprenyl-3-methyl-5-hydroxy-6-metoxy-1,4-benzoquinol methylase
MKRQRNPYQYGFSERYASFLFDPQRQNQKAEKVKAILRDYFGGPNPLKKLSLLDIGCSAGLMTQRYSEEFGCVVGIDIDAPAIEFAQHNLATDNLSFLVRDGLNTGFEQEAFDVVTCCHIYEHVPNREKLLAEIHRVLKKGGVCYFAGHNRISLIEPHYGLPLLSLLPKPAANIYLRVFGKGDFYYERLLSSRGLRKLVSAFDRVDYTVKSVEDPLKYCATDMLEPGSVKQMLAKMILKSAYFLCPTYIWLLLKTS